MNTRIVMSAAAAIMLSASVGALAAPTETIHSNEMRASKIIGSNVYDVNNQKIGSVEDIVLGPQARVDSVIVDVGSYLGMGGKYVAVKMSAIKTDNNRLTLNETKSQLQQAPAYQLADNNTGAGEGTSPVNGGNAANPK